MFSFKWWVLYAGLAFSANLEATPPLTTVSDTLFNADGTQFNGLVVISSPSFEASDTSNIAAQTIRIPVNNGVLYVQLIPTTDANTAAIYTVQYTSLGVTQFSETWTVPPSILPVRVRDVRIAPGSITGSGPGAATIINISDINGLQGALNVRAAVGPGFAPSRAAVINPAGGIDGAVGNSSDCVHVDGSSSACSSGTSTNTSTTFVDSETPSGSLNGSNATFLLANIPTPANSVTLFRNGLFLRQGGDYTVAANIVTFVSGAEPQPGDVLAASYRLSTSNSGVGFIDQETPAGSINGINTAFTLSQSPVPTSSLMVYRNGVHLSAGVDFNAAGSVITFLSNQVPQSGDTVVCSYRIVQ